MGLKTVEVKTDDLDGSVISEGDGRAVTVGIDGESINLDLTNTHIEELKSLLTPYFKAVGRSLPGQQNRRSSPAPSPTTRRDMREIREWAVRNNMKVSERGRIPFAVMDAYTRSHMG